MQSMWKHLSRKQAYYISLLNKAAFSVLLISNISLNSSFLHNQNTSFEAHLTKHLHKGPCFQHYIHNRLVIFSLVLVHSNLTDFFPYLIRIKMMLDVLLIRLCYSNMAVEQIFSSSYSSLNYHKVSSVHKVKFSPTSFNAYIRYLLYTKKAEILRHKIKTS